MAGELGGRDGGLVALDERRVFGGVGGLAAGGGGEEREGERSEGNAVGHGVGASGKESGRRQRLLAGLGASGEGGRQRRSEEAFAFLEVGREGTVVRLGRVE